MHLLNIEWRIPMAGAQVILDERYTKIPTKGEMAPFFESKQDLPKRPVRRGYVGNHAGLQAMGQPGVTTTPTPVTTPVF
jgi:hypothetical protein